MSASFSKTILLGHVGKDPEFKTTTSGTAAAKFSIATNESYKDAQGVKQEKVEWHNIVAFARLAEVVRDYVRKGSMIMVEGRNKTSSWKDSDSGKTMYRTEIMVNSIQLMGKPGSSDKQDDGATAEAKAGARSNRGNGNGFEQTYAETEITDDDIPF